MDRIAVYCGAVRVRDTLRDGEFVVVTVTPVWRGVSGPLATTLTAFALVWATASTWSWPKNHAALLSVLVVAPCAVVLGGRLWRWRSHKIVVTSQRIIQFGGVARRRMSSVELIDVDVSHTNQRWFERLTRRGYVVVETPSGAFVLERVRRPDALARVIDHQRQQVDRYAELRLDRADELSAALEAGLLTNEEYDQRWRRLFGPSGPRL